MQTSTAPPAAPIIVCSTGVTLDARFWCWCASVMLKDLRRNAPEICKDWQEDLNAAHCVVFEVCASKEVAKHAATFQSSLCSVSVSDYCRDLK